MRFAPDLQIVIMHCATHLLSYGLIPVVVCAFLASSAVGAEALEGMTSAPRPAAAVVPATPSFPAVPVTNNESANAVTQAAVQKGALSCASRINQVTNFLGITPQAGALLMAPPAQIDQRLLPVVIETPAESADVGSAYISIAFAPNQVNGCGATYDAVMYWRQKCDAVATRYFGSLRKSGALRKDIAVLDGGPATKVFLMPAGSGCVSIKKEVVL